MGVEAEHVYRPAILAAGKCGCFHCCRIFASSDITEWDSEDLPEARQRAFCPQCGAAQASRANFCPDCGADLSAGAPPVVRREDEPVGAIAIYKLFCQKDGLTHLDGELFGLLAGHAATAICSARLYSASKRKLETMSGFLELMSSGSGPAA